MNFKKSFILTFSILIISGLVGCSFITYKEKDEDITSIPKDILDNIIKEYVEPISVETFNGGKSFCDYIIIDSDNDGNKINIYLWLLAQEYFVQDSKLLEGAGGEFSAVLTVEQNGNNYKFLNCDISRAIDLKESLNIFPENVRKKASQNSVFDEASLSKIESKAKNYFNK